MKYEVEYLIADIVDTLEETMTRYKQHWFEYDDCIVSVSGRVQQDFEYDRGDYWTPPYCELKSRTADFDEIVFINEDGERAMTVEEIYYIEKEVDKWK